MDRIEKLLSENNGLLTEIRDELKKINIRAEQIETQHPLNGQADELMRLATKYLEGAEP